VLRHLGLILQLEDGAILLLLLMMAAVSDPEMVTVG
jgi:hypothetical protein